MKRYITNILLLLLLALTASAATTTDRVRLSASTPLMPGGDAVAVTVSIIGGEHTYTGYNIDIVIPDGFTIVYDEAQESYLTPSPTMYTSHEVLGNMIILDGKHVLRTSCLSIGNKPFNAAEGSLFSFKLKAPLFTKPGATEIGIKNTDFAVYQNKVVTPFHFANTTSTDITVSLNATATVSISSATQWGTLMLPFAATLPDGITAYSCDSNDDENLILSPVTEIAAFTPYIIYSAQGFNVSLSGTIPRPSFPESGIVSQGYLRASTTDQTLTDGYVMQKQGDEVQFYKVNGSKPVTVAAGKCWAEIPSSLASKAAFGITIDHGTGIAPPTAIGNAPTMRYTIDGKRARGTREDLIMIHQGKKFKP